SVQAARVVTDVQLGRDPDLSRRDDIYFREIEPRQDAEPARRDDAWQIECHERFCDARVNPRSGPCNCAVRRAVPTCHATDSFVAKRFSGERELGHEGYRGVTPATLVARLNPLVWRYSSDARIFHRLIFGARSPNSANRLNFYGCPRARSSCRRRWSPARASSLASQIRD